MLTLTFNKPLHAHAEHFAYSTEHVASNVTQVTRLYEQIESKQKSMSCCWRVYKEDSLGRLLCRITTLMTENKTVKQQLQTMLDKDHHDNELIESLLV